MVAALFAIGVPVVIALALLVLMIARVIQGQSWIIPGRVDGRKDV